MMRKLLLTTFCSMALSLSAYAEVYRSPGFSAEIGTNGVIRNLRFKDMPLAKEIMLNGEYQIPKGVEKHDARFFQTWDYSKKAVFKRDGEKLSFSVKSTLSNKKFKDAADYQVVCVMEPNRISIQSEVTQKIDLQTQLRLFQTHIVMPASLFGRGVQVIRKGQEEFKVLPETYNPKFRLGGDSLRISTEKGILAFSGGKEITFSYMDSRMWGGKDFTLIVNPPAKWTAKPVTHPAGTVWKWDFTMTFQPE